MKEENKSINAVFSFRMLFPTFLSCLQEEILKFLELALPLEYAYFMAFMA